jgi:hypothetical protein
MLQARFQADGPAKVVIRDQIGSLDFPSGEQTLHLGMSVLALRQLERSIHDALCEFDMEKRAAGTIGRKLASV